MKRAIVLAACLGILSACASTPAKTLDSTGAEKFQPTEPIVYGVTGPMVCEFPGSGFSKYYACMGEWQVTEPCTYYFTCQDIIDAEGNMHTVFKQGKEVCLERPGDGWPAYFGYVFGDRKNLQCEIPWVMK